MGNFEKDKRSPSVFWGLVDKHVPLLSKLALRLFGIAVNPVAAERFFSQAGIIHTKLRHRAGHERVTTMAQVRAELHRHRPTRKRKFASLSGGAAAQERGAEQTAAAGQLGTADTALFEADAILSQEELDQVVMEWFEELDDEEIPDASAVVVAGEAQLLLKSPLSYIFGSPLEALGPVTPPTMEELIMMRMLPDMGQLDEASVKQI